MEIASGQPTALRPHGPARRWPEPGAVAAVLHPITWFAPMWAFSCGLVSAASPPAGRWGLVAAGVVLAGPAVCGTSQAINDWFDREVDALNEPNRPIPSGRIPGQWGLAIAIVLTVISMLLGLVLGRVGFAATLVGLALAWAYSAPPLRLKRNGWWGNAACGACYEGLPWITGAAVLSGGVPAWPVFALAGLYSLGAHGIMTLNDFKSVAGDRATGIGSLPVRLGEDRAARFACAVMALPQAIVVGLLIYFHRPVHAATVAVLLAVQLVLMRRFLRDPRALAPWYNGTGTTLYVLGMLASAFALRGLS